MPRVCFVPGCNTTSKSRHPKDPDEKHVTLFSAPKDPILRKQWHIASRRADREMTERDFMCELHFTEDRIDRHFMLPLFDGKTFKLERKRPNLLKGSIPTIFDFSNSSRVAKLGRPKKVCNVQNKETGNRDFVSRKKSSPSKLSKQVTVRSCSAYGCTNSSDKKVHGVSFHRFPANKTRRKAWIIAVGKKDWQPSKDSALCSAHFSPDQIESAGSAVRLRPGAVPTIFSFGEESYDSSDSARYESYSMEINDIPNQDSDEDEVPPTVADSFDKAEENEEISENLIVEGHEEIFGKFVANELKILLCDPPLYLRTKEKIWRVLEKNCQM